MKPTRTEFRVIKFDDLITILALGVMFFLFLGGCAHQQRSVELQCTPAIKEDVEGPVIMRDGDLVFYDSKGRLRKVTGTCGVR